MYMAQNGGAGGCTSCCLRGVLDVPPMVLEVIRVLGEVQLVLGSLTRSVYWEL